jgi:hypothetical protein
MDFWMIEGENYCACLYKYNVIGVCNNSVVNNKKYIKNDVYTFIHNLTMNTSRVEVDAVYISFF